MSAKQVVRAHSLINFKPCFCLCGNWPVDHLPLCEVFHEVTPRRCYLSCPTVWLKTAPFPKRCLPVGPSTVEGMCADLFDMGLYFCWHSLYSEDEWKSFLVSKHCDNDNVIVFPGRPHIVQKIAGSRTVPKVSAADTAQGGSWQVADGEWQRKRKGCFTRRMVLPSRGKGPTCRGICWGVSTVLRAVPPQGEDSTVLEKAWGSGNLHTVESGKYFPTVWRSCSYLNATCDLHWFSLLAVTQERFCIANYSLAI